MTSNSPLSTLGSTRWRVLHSSWMLSPILLFGLGTGPSFLYVGLRAQRKRWWIPGIVYLALIVVVFVLAEVSTDIEDAYSDWSAGLLIAVWLGGILHASLINGPWLRWLAAKQSGRAHVPSTMVPPQNQVSASSTNDLRDLGISTSGYYGSPGSTVVPSAARQDTPRVPSAPPVPGENGPSAPPAETVDVNLASLEELSTLLGVSREVATRAISERDARAGFSSLDEFAIAAGLEPHVYARLRSRLTCSPRPQNPSAGGRRILDF